MKKQPNPLEGKRFSEVIAELAYGETDRQVAGALRRLVTACQETGKKGKVTFTIEVDPGDPIVTLSSKTTVTIPQPSAPATSFFVGDDGELSQQDPRQMTLRRVDDAPGKPRVVDFPRAKRGDDDGNDGEN